MAGSEYYNHTTYPAPNSSGASADLRAELENVESGFGKLITLSGTANKLIKVNSGETAHVASIISDDGATATVTGDLAVTGSITGYQVDLAVPSQAEAEAGTATDERVWTAERVGQAISALGSGDPNFVGQNQSATPSAGGTDSIAVGHAANASGTRGIAIGNSTFAAGNDAVSVGNSCNAAGLRGSAFGRQANASAVESIAIGYIAASPTTGQISFSTGNVTGGGKAQSIKFIAKGATTDATPRVINPDNATTSTMVLLANSMWAFQIRLAVRENATGDSKMMLFDGLIKRDGSSNTSIVGSVTSSTPAEDTGASTWTASVTADDTNEALKITVTGQASHSLNWVAVVDITEVSG